MADSKISALTALAAGPASGDLFVIVDVSDTSMAASGTDKKITFANVMASPTITSATFNTASTFNSHNPSLAGDGGAYGFWTYSYMAGTSGGGQNAFLRAGGSLASPTGVLNNMGLGALSFRGHNTSTFTGSKALIGAYAAENWTTGANGTYIQFKTTPAGSTNLTDRMTIAQDGSVGIGTSTANGLLHVYSASNHAPSLNAHAAAGAVIELGGVEMAMGVDVASPYPMCAQAKAGGVAYPISLNPLGGNVGIGITAPTAVVHAGASTTARASLCLPHGTAPTAPVDGDIWTTTAGLFVRINGVTKTVTLT